MDHVGFLGLGIMGRPMATRLAAAGTPLTVWSRTAAHCDDAVAAGAQRAADPDEALRRSAVMLLMLATEAAIDEVLGRGTPAFATRVAGRVIVPMGTTTPEYATRLAADVRAAGGRYVEAPVSGSRVPAETGELVAMVAGEAADLERVRPLLAPLCRSVVGCGNEPGAALRMKLAVNAYLVTTVAALAEAAHLAERLGLDLEAFCAVVDGGQLASPIARVKGAKLLRRDFTAQAAIHDVHKNSRYVVEAARACGAATPLAEVADQLYAETLAAGHGGADMAAVLLALEQRTGASVAP
jgi:3-hydroxyisobutyrate dehydrogenase